MIRSLEIGRRLQAGSGFEAADCATKDNLSQCQELVTEMCFAVSPNSTGHPVIPRLGVIGIHNTLWRMISRSDQTVSWCTIISSRRVLTKYQPKARGLRDCGSV